MQYVMLNLLRNLLPFMQRRQSPLARVFGGRRSAVTPARAGMGLGTIASIAAPFVIRKLMARRAAARAAY
jgi:hypothetical protein